MRISDWSSDVCSSDLALRFGRAARARRTEGVPMNITLAMLAAPVALIATALPAQDQAGDIADKIINNPNPQAFQVFNAPEPARVVADKTVQGGHRSEEHTSELQSLMRISYAVFCLKQKNTTKHNNREP